MASGILIFEKQGCVQCHSISGKGKIRLPLDRIGSRMSEQEIQQWIIAGPMVKNKLSTVIVRVKSSYADMPNHEMNQLMTLLINSKQTD